LAPAITEPSPVVVELERVADDPREADRGHRDAGERDQPRPPPEDRQRQERHEQERLLAGERGEPDGGTERQRAAATRLLAQPQRRQQRERDQEPVERLAHEQRLAIDDRHEHRRGRRRGNAGPVPRKSPRDQADHEHRAGPERAAHDLVRGVRVEPDRRRDRQQPGEQRRMERGGDRVAPVAEHDGAVRGDRVERVAEAAPVHEAVRHRVEPDVVAEALRHVRGKRVRHPQREAGQRDGEQRDQRGTSTS
jgi:hypothetical protein